MAEEAPQKLHGQLVLGGTGLTVFGAQSSSPSYMAGLKGVTEPPRRDLVETMGFANPTKDDRPQSGVGATLVSNLLVALSGFANRSREPP